MRHDPLQAGSEHTAECTPEKCNLWAPFSSCFEPHESETIAELSSEN